MKIAAADHQTIIDMVTGDNMRLEDVAKALGCSKSAIAAIMYRYGWHCEGNPKARTWRQTGPVMTAARTQEVVMISTETGDDSLDAVIAEAQALLAEATQTITVLTKDIAILRQANGDFAQEVHVLRNELKAAQASAQRAWDQAKQDHQDALSWREYQHHVNQRKREESKGMLHEQMAGLRNAIAKVG